MLLFKDIFRLFVLIHSALVYRRKEWEFEFTDVEIGEWGDLEISYNFIGIDNALVNKMDVIHVLDRRE